MPRVETWVAPDSKTYLVRDVFARYHRAQSRREGRPGTGPEQEVLLLSVKVSEGDVRSGSRVTSRDGARIVLKRFT